MVQTLQPAHPQGWIKKRGRGGEERHCMTLNTLQGLDFVCSYTEYTKKEEGVGIGCIKEGVGGGGWSIGNRGKG
jgi:hypothetical protein